MRSGLLASLLLGATLAACSAPSPPPPPAPRATIEAAQAAIGSGTPASAVPSLLALLAATPEDALARAVLAHALLLGGDVEGSLVQGKLAVGIDPALSEASWNLACAYARVGDRDAAVAWLQRALITGSYEPKAVRDDADLATLIDDHRVAVYFATGVLSRAEEDVLVQLDTAQARVGQPLLLSLALVQLNREPLSTTEAELDLGRDRGLESFEIIGRRETFSRGEAGGREYVQRTVHFEVVPHAPGPHVLGPFRMRGQDGVHWTRPVTVVVEGEPSATAPLPGFFGLPSHEDPALVAQLGDDSLWELGGPVPELALPQALRFRLPTLEGEITLPPRPANSRRSAFLRRSTEGVSWVVDIPRH